MTPNRGRKSSSKKSSSLLIFVSFVILGLLTVLVLEYLDYKKGKETFLLKKIFTRSMETDNRDEFNRRLILLLENEGIRFKYFEGDDGLFHFKLDVGGRDPSPLTGKIIEISNELGFKLDLSEIQKQADGETALYIAAADGVETHAILINRHTPPRTVRKKEKIFRGDGKPKIAFIIDDIGNRRGISGKLRALGIPISASILPDTPFAAEEAENFRKFGLEAMIHLPMQPKNSHNHANPRYPVIKPNSEAEEIREIVRNAKIKVPHARGVNNHEGSLVTSLPDIMERVLKVIKSEGLYFVDSKTSVDTVAYHLARELKIKTASRDVFLDSTQSYSFSIEQIGRLIQIARKKGRGIAIGHPFESTIRAIKDSIKDIGASGIEIVFVSQILE